MIKEKEETIYKGGKGGRLKDPSYNQKPEGYKLTKSKKMNLSVKVKKGEFEFNFNLPPSVMIWGLVVLLFAFGLGPLLLPLLPFLPH